MVLIRRSSLGVLLIYLDGHANGDIYIKKSIETPFFWLILPQVVVISGCLFLTDVFLACPPFPCMFYVE